MVSGEVLGELLSTLREGEFAVTTAGSGRPTASWDSEVRMLRHAFDTEVATLLAWAYAKSDTDESLRRRIVGLAVAKLANDVAATDQFVLEIAVLRDAE